MRRLTRPEIEAGGKAMSRIMQFHDQLIGARLMRVTGRRSVNSSPPLLIFEQGVTLATQSDDEGNPGASEWQVTDREGYLYHPVQVHDLVRQQVTGVGYFHDPENDCRAVIPFVEIADTFLICCMTPHGGGVIHHHRPREDSWDLSANFESNPNPRNK